MKARLVDGTQLEGTPKEISDAMRELWSLMRLKPSSDGRFRFPRLSQEDTNALSDIAVDGEATAIWTEDRVRALWNWLYGNQKKLVQFLIDHGGRARKEELEKVLGIKKGNELAGLLSCITRNARRETKYGEAEVVCWERGDDGREYYRIVPQVYEILKGLAV